MKSKNERHSNITMFILWEKNCPFHNFCKIGSLKFSDFIVCTLYKGGGGLRFSKFLKKEGVLKFSVKREGFSIKWG